MKKVNLKELKKGEFFTLQPNEFPTEGKVYIKGEYDRTDEKYSCCKFNDMMAERFFKGTKEVWVDFIF